MDLLNSPSPSRPPRRQDRSGDSARLAQINRTLHSAPPHSTSPPPFRKHPSPRTLSKHRCDLLAAPESHRVRTASPSPLCSSTYTPTHLLSTLTRLTRYDQPFPDRNVNSRKHFLFTFPLPLSNPSSVRSIPHGPRDTPEEAG
uniref:Uncharacterized protein n=1 Tax=Knipowitschia caucasica TaxID=637954 RepID=A0AAV2JEE2_KNICA